ncbi:hypothetical protein [Pelagibacterium sp. H642]|uniref:hypothetical protein n=1 Tax=Pelagibacterium sp. H642 TaxID=1881069 RepID=UPI0028159907|nr:hypothetical protein [Pelagibacterium sp. H642]WMT89073.1 hypothetical protein NO934_09560 [Pelagibacterium sp. H642]
MSDAQEVFDGLSTKMRLHRDRIPEGAARYSLETIDDRQALDALFTCYRGTPTQVECSMKNPFAFPMRISEVRRRLDEFEPANRAAFERYVAAFNAVGDEPIEMVIPAYALGKEGFLLLDGNHRATAAAIAGRPFRLTLATLNGPVDRRILKDLKFWDGGLKRFGRRLRRTLGAGAAS